jgi:hypothetical protein
MTQIHDRLLDELAFFADLGTDPPRGGLSGSNFIVHMLRNGEPLTLTFLDGGPGKIVERWAGEQSRTHASYRALLASDRFADLRKWADVQRDVLARTLGDPEQLISIYGTWGADPTRTYVWDVENILENTGRRGEDSARVLLIDGPAGIGKTIFIEQLAALRARGFRATGRPLILHVQSRGRNLSFIQDLMAFSLQTLRLAVTYDQVPVLVRQGLVTLAIDGFDELGDPSGYDLAWGQVNELVNQVRGKGTLILAGRETFIGRDRLFKDVRTLSRTRDIVDSLTLNLPDPYWAKRWLVSRGWSETDMEGLEELFEQGSYALRPFFLAKLAEPEIAAEIRGRKAGYPLSFLVDRMIEREAVKFGDAVNAVMNKDQRVRFVRQFLRETARDMADNQTESIDEMSLALLTEVALGADVSADILGLLKNRAAVMAFLTVDERPRYRCFAHSQLLNHFLGEVTVDAIQRGEVPKYVRRNILGADFLSAFSDLLSEYAGSDPDLVKRFLQSASVLAHSYLSFDRGARNLGGILLTALPLVDIMPAFRLEGLEIDDAVIKETASVAEIARVTISQLDIRGADIKAVTFSETTIVTLIADSSTTVPSSFPNPYLIQDETLDRTATILAQKEISDWLDRHGRVEGVNGDGVDEVVPQELRNHELYRLFQRACRFKQYWIRSDSDILSAQIVNDPWWNDLEDVLDRSGFLRKETNRQASGSASAFYHIKRRDAFLNPDPNNSVVAGVYHALAEKVRRSNSPVAR